MSIPLRLLINLMAFIFWCFCYRQHSQVMQQESLQAHRYVQHQHQALLQQTAMMSPPLSEDVMNLDSSNPLSLTTNTTQSNFSSLGDFSDASNFAQMLQEILGDNDGKYI